MQCSWLKNSEEQGVPYITTASMWYFVGFTTILQPPLQYLTASFF
jgi:hypothetical protein